MTMGKFFKNADKNFHDRMSEKNRQKKEKINFNAKYCREAVENSRNKKSKQIEDTLIAKTEEAIKNAIGAEQFWTEIYPLNWFNSGEYVPSHINSVFHENVVSSLELNGFHVDIYRSCNSSGEIKSLSARIYWGVEDD